MALVAYGSLYPWEFRSGPTLDTAFRVVLHSWPGQWNRWVLRDVALNFLLYVPVGAAAFLSLVRRRTAAAVAGAAAVALALTVTMETLQVYVPGRDPSLLDVTTNFAGGAAGALAGALLRRRAEALGSVLRREAAPGAGFLLATWATAQLYPFFPVVSLYRLRIALQSLSHAGAFSGVEAWAGAAEWMAALCALDAIGAGTGAWLAAVPVALAALRPLIVTRTITLPELAGAACAGLLWLAAGRRRPQAAAWMLCAAIVLRELAPFDPSPTAAPFSWVPFQATLAADRQMATIMLARKAFDYGAAIWLLRRVGVRWAAPAVAAALLGLELVQQHLPGRTPEVTDAVIALLMAGILQLVKTGRAGGAPLGHTPAGTADSAR